MPATVSGKVTLDGRPLTTGNVAFYPTTGAPAVGSIGSDGVYKLNTGTQAGITPGEYKVTVLATKELPPPTDGSAPLPPAPITPAKYGTRETTPFTFTVKAGSNTFDLPLTSN